MIAAFDPGITGAYAILDDAHQVIALGHLPTLQAQHGRAAKVRNELGLHALRDVLVQHAVSQALLERVAAMTRQGVTSTLRPDAAK